MADFEEEARLARETVTRSASNPNAALGFLALSSRSWCSG